MPALTAFCAVPNVPAPFSASVDFTARATGDQVWVTEEEESVWSVTASPDGHFVLTGTGYPRNAVRKWDASALQYAPFEAGWAQGRVVLPAAEA